MFPRKKKNRTGTISVVVVDKSRGGFKEIKSFGVAKTEEEAGRLYSKASEWVRRYGGQQEIDFVQSSIVQQEFLESERVLNNISAVVLNGPQQILNQVYDSIGFDRIRDEVLRHLVIARICQPLSKSATADYLKSYFHEDVSLDQIYRYMDKLYNKQRELVQQISVEHTRRILGGSIGLSSTMSRHYILRPAYRTICARTDSQKTGRPLSLKSSWDCWSAQTAIRCRIPSSTERNMKGEP